MSASERSVARPKRGAEIELEIEKFADKGKSIGRLGGYVVFVRGAVPGDVVRAKVYKRKKSYAEAQVEEVLRPSPLRVEPRCFYFGTCGGCTWQHVDYEAQLEAKRESVEGALGHQGGFDMEAVEVRPTLASPDVYFYRNKMEFSFGADRWLTPEEIATGREYDKDFAIGLHVPGNFWKVLDLKECHLQSELSRRIVNGVRDFARGHDWEPWDIRKHVGYLRHLVIRTGTNTGEVMVNLVTNGFDEERMQLLAEYLQADFPEVTTFVNTINTGTAQTAFGDEEHVIYGRGVIHDMIGGYRFEIASNAFFQTNTKQAERLYEVAREFADLRPDDLLYDLYCGAGTISIFMSEHVGRVLGVELIEEAVENARMNAGMNGVENCTFLAGDLRDVFTDAFVKEHGRPDVLIVDPPRGGMHPKVVEQIARLHPERFVYVSCNPQTQARDLKMLGNVFQIDAVQPVDMFPQTDHVESVVKLRRR